jgi:hypothetical protein
MVDTALSSRQPASEEAQAEWPMVSASDAEQIEEDYDSALCHLVAAARHIWETNEPQLLWCLQLTIEHVKYLEAAANEYSTQTSTEHKAQIGKTNPALVFMIEAASMLCSRSVSNLGLILERLQMAIEEVKKNS